MKIRYRIALEIVLEGKSKKDIANKFMNLDLGKLDSEHKSNNPKSGLQCWDYSETECCNLVEEDGTVGEEISQP